MTYRIFCFVKFFETEEWADDFMQGNLYCNTLQYFRDREQTEDFRGDPFEGTVSLIQPGQAIIKFSFNSETINDLTIDPKDLVGPVIIHSTDTLEHNVFCLYAIYIDDDFEEFSDDELSDEELENRIISVSEKLKLHEDCFGMGQHVVLIYAVEPFIEALKKYEKEKDMRLRRALVKYYDEMTYHGDFKEAEAIFHKPHKYSHQKEYRLAFRSPDKAAFTISIGSMEAYAKKMTADDIRTLSFRVEPKGH
ncbi:hypothetical protein [Janthinobacterium sp. 1_2014MBL_MicDiv]|uniref:hypothetical protein n=1 Tax=Janthinobacterium sp. 1_2014MBL_MicDiv TaxID=1644131 RepID=UPI0008F48911|nr:hypothetical protein [Janthinobacterium sp. 1_2014MBL_MicDiv]APA69892.1 hypothetical protein YQ44_21215 [Janthinobacterium sp. 1_2014MBL_MicDiv]